MAAMLNRRRAIGITAAAAGLALLPIDGRGFAIAEEVTWQGQALGAPAMLRIHHHDREHALRLVESVAAEVRRLERIFSLYRDDSDLVRLNRQGMLLAPPFELVELLQLASRYWELSGGAFDPTVQPLWNAYRAHFSTPDADPAGPPAAALETALARTGFDGVRFDTSRIDFRRPRMALTLNGIAQGYITDRITALLRAGGIETCLVDIGETRGVGHHRDGGGWRIGIADPSGSGQHLDVLEVVDRAVATSSPSGFVFDAGGRFNHLIDPRSGHSARRYASVTIVATDATIADGLSTACSLMDPDAIEAAIAALPETEVHLFHASRGRTLLRS